MAARPCQGFSDIEESSVMAENLFCDYCSEPASTFGFLQPNLKSKVCRNHVLTLVDKGIAMFPIEAYSFMRSPQDSAEYEERRREQDKEMGRLEALNSQCESDWAAAQQLLLDHSSKHFACLQRCYKELWQRTEQRYTLTKQRIDDARARLRILSRDPIAPPLTDVSFHVQLSDCRLAVADALLSAFALTSAPPPPSSPTPDTDLELNLRLVLSATEADLLSTANALQLSSEHASARGDFSAAVAELRRGRDFLRQHNHFTFDLPLALTLFRSRQYEPTVTLCEEILQTEHSPLEHLSALYYLSDSLHGLKKKEEGYAAVDKYTRQIVVDNADSQCVSLYIQANQLFRQGRKSEAKRVYEEALQSDLLPHSFLTAASLFVLAFLYSGEGNKEEAERQWLRSCAIFSEYFPYSYAYGLALNMLGNFYRAMNRLGEAQERYEQAHALLSVHYPQSSTFGLCLYEMGLLCESRGERGAAKERFKEALPLLEKHSFQIFVNAAEAALKRLSS